MPRAAAYVRVSTVDQKERESHKEQKKQISEWAEREEYDAVDYYQDIAISGQSETREEYSRLMESYENYDAVVVRELSRLGRDPLTVMEDVEQIIESDTDFISITENFDTSTAMGRAFLRILSVINGMYADLRREQAIRAAERRKEEGKPVGRPEKLTEAQKDDVFDLRRKGVSYNAIANVVEGWQGEPEEISGETIRRVCKKAGVEPERD